MEAWLIWVIVIVLVVAVAWWLLSRGRNASSPDGISPSAPHEAPRQETAPQPDAQAVGVMSVTPPEGSPVPVLPVPAPDTTPEPAAAPAEKTVTAEQPAASEGPAPDEEPAPDERQGSEAGGGDVDDWDDAGSAASGEAIPPQDSGGDAVTTAPVAEAVVEPVDEPGLAEPVTEEPVLTETVAEDAATEGVTADDVAAADAGPLTGADKASTADTEDPADKAEWEASWSDAPPRQVPGHNPEYTAAHAPTLPGAETAAAETLSTEPAGTEPADAGQADAATAESSPTEEAAQDAPPAGGHLAAGQPYGEGSASAGPDGSGPADFTVKADAGTMTYYDEDMPAYAEARASVWFLSAAHAEAAGFRPPRRATRY